MTVFSAQKGATNLSPEQVEAILAELCAIQAGPSFCGTKRCLDFLDFIVRRAIAGDFEHLSERFLGVELFGRPLDYETSSDAIVRVRANDVRRRLAQHYSEQHSTTGVTISLASGTYIPEFHWVEVTDPNLLELTRPGPLNVGSPTETVEPSRKSVWTAVEKLRRPVAVVLTLLLLTGIVTAFLLHRFAAPDSALERFWQPLFKSKGLVTLRFGDTVSYWISPELRKVVEAGQPVISVKPGEILETWGDSSSSGGIRSALSIANLLSRHGVPSRIRWPQEIQEEELARANVIYIGGFNNSWTMSLNRNLRFSFQEADTAAGHTWMICDHIQPNRKWSMTRTYPQQIDHDYALITRILDPERKRVVISLGGMNQFGSQAAAEFLTDEAAMSEFAKSAPKGWEKRNLQIVLEMEVSGNRAVNPRIVAANVW